MTSPTTNTLVEAMRIARHISTFGVPQGGEQWPNAACCLDAGRDLEARIKRGLFIMWRPDMERLATILQEVWTKPEIDPKAALKGWPESLALANAYDRISISRPISAEAQFAALQAKAARARFSEADLLRAAQVPRIASDRSVDTSAFEGTGWAAACEPDPRETDTLMIVWTHTSGARVLPAGAGACVVHAPNGSGSVHGVCVLDALRIAAPGSV